MRGARPTVWRSRSNCRIWPSGCATRQPVTIVAIGGASTKGAAAGSPDLAYPHRLQNGARHVLPREPINVVNKGVPRQSARQMVERFPTDVLAEDPVLVVWETGITDAVRGIEIDEFAAALQTGIDELKNRAIDIVLVDMQFSRSTATVIDFEQYLNAIHRVGELNDVYVFPRFAMMRYWSEQNVFNFDEVARRSGPAGREGLRLHRPSSWREAIRLAADDPPAAVAARRSPRCGDRRRAAPCTPSPPVHLRRAGRRWPAIEPALDRTAARRSTPAHKLTIVAIGSSSTWEPARAPRR